MLLENKKCMNQAGRGIDCMHGKCEPADNAASDGGNPNPAEGVDRRVDPPGN